MASSADIVALVQIQMATTTLLTSDGFTAAVNSAVSELGWTLPETNSTRIWWITKRAVRYACYILWVASAQNFKYKQVNLQHRFDHYDKLIKQMDNEFAEALTSQPALFASVDTYKMFGTLVGPGFVYDSMGQDITYTDLENYINTGL